MANASALRDAIATTWAALGVPANVRGSRKGYRHVAKVPEVGAGSHRDFWFEPPQYSGISGQGAARTTYNVQIDALIALHLSGLSPAQQFDAIEAEALTLMSAIHTMGAPPGTHGTQALPATWEREEGAPDDFTLTIPIVSRVAESNPP